MTGARRTLGGVSRHSLAERIAERLRAVRELPGGGRIAGFWIRPDPYLDRDEAVVLILDLLDDVIGADLVSASTRAAVTKSVDASERVAEALDDLIPTSCRFGTSADLEALGPPLDPGAFYPLQPAA